MPERLPVASGHFLLALDDELALLKDCDGGNIKGQVLTTNIGPQQPAEKHISTLKFEPFTIDVGIPMGKPLATWIMAALALSPTSKKGYVAQMNIENRAQNYRHFRDALIEEITIPGMDAASKEAALFTIKFQPEQTTYAKGDNAVLASVVNVKQKKWLCSNFRLRIGNLPCARVNRVDSFTIKQRIATDTVGEGRTGSTRRPTNVEFPNLKITFSATDVGPWQDWFTDFVVNGQNDQKKELQGLLEFLDPTMQEVLGSVELSQIGIFSLQMDRQEANTDAVARYVAELYVEKMALNLKFV
jgi:hypothetical protein